jgi:hypothetical protein
MNDDVNRGVDSDEPKQQWGSLVQFFSKFRNRVLAESVVVLSLLGGWLIQSVVPENTRWTVPARGLLLIGEIGLLGLLVLGVTCLILFLQKRELERKPFCLAALGVKWDKDATPLCRVCEGPIYESGHAFYCDFCKAHVVIRENGRHLDIHEAVLKVKEMLKDMKIRR